MDWAKAIDLNRDALLRLLAALFASVGRASGGAEATVPRYVRTNLLRVLRPFESALRRLIVVAAREVSVTLRSAAKGVARPFPETGIARGDVRHPAAFPLFDRRKRFDVLPSRRFAKSIPRLTIFGWNDDTRDRDVAIEAPARLPDDAVDSARLYRRLTALKLALEDMPRQARRLARAQARRALAPSGPRRAGPLRPGHPPGHTAKPMRQIDEILSECHLLALRSMIPPDTS